MASDILNQIEKEIKGEVKTPEIPSETKEVVEIVEKANESTSVDTTDDEGEVEPVKKSEVKTEKLSRRQLAAKESAERISKLEQSLSEERKQREAKEKMIADIAPFAEELKKVQERQKQEALNKNIQTNPVEALNKLVEDRLAEALAPIKQREQLIQDQQFADNTFSKWKSLAASEEEFKGTSPVLTELINNTVREKGPQVAKYIADNFPEAMFRMARDIYNENLRKNQATQSNENLKKKQEMANINASISKPNQMSKNESKADKNATRQEINNFLLSYAGQK